MKKWHSFFLRMFILLFTLSISITIIPCNSINILGLFGEVKSSTVSEDNNYIEELDKQNYAKSYKYKGINIINIWYELWCSIVCMIFILYINKLTRGDTIATLKVRMDD